MNTTTRNKLCPADAKTLYEGLLEVFFDYQYNINSAKQWLQYAYQINTSLYQNGVNLNSLYNDLKTTLSANDRKKLRVMFEVTLSSGIVHNQNACIDYIETLRHYIAITQKSSRKQGRLLSFSQTINQIGKYKVISINAKNTIHKAILISLESCGAIRVKKSYLHQFADDVFSGSLTPEDLQAFDFFSSTSPSTIQTLKSMYISYFSKNNLNIDNRLENHRVLNSIFFTNHRELLSRAFAGVFKSLDDICNIKPSTPGNHLSEIESKIEWSFNFLRDSISGHTKQEAEFFLEDILTRKINTPGNINKQTKSKEMIRLIDVFLKQIDLFGISSHCISDKALKIGSHINDDYSNNATIVAAEIVARGQGDRFPFRQALAHVILKNAPAKEIMKNFEKSPLIQHAIYAELQDEALVPHMSDNAKRAVISTDLGI